MISARLKRYSSSLKNRGSSRGLSLSKVGAALSPLAGIAILDMFISESVGGIFGKTRLLCGEELEL